MKKKVLHLVLILCYCMIGLSVKATEKNTPSITDANVYGHVVDAKSGKHIPYVRIVVKGTTLEAATDATGHFFLKNLPIGEYEIEASSMGYRTESKTVVTSPKTSQECNFELTEDAISLDEVVLTANRSQTLRREAPALVNVLSTKLFETTNAMCMAQGLNFQPGVRTEDNCQNCGFSQVRINGLDGHYSQILIDSRPIFTSLNGVYGLEQIPANMIERVEVMRGGGSALYGASAIGGTINVITKEPLRNSAEIAHTLSSVGGKSSFDNNTNANASIVSEDGKAGFYLYGQNRNRQGYDHDGDGYTELPQLRNNTIGLSTYYKLNPFSKFSLQYHHISEFRRGGNKLTLAPHEANITEQLDHDIHSANLSYDFISRNAKDRVKAYYSFSNTLRKSYYGGISEGTPENIEDALKAYGRTKDFTCVTGGQYVHHFDHLFFMPSTLTAGGEFSFDHLKDNILGYHHKLYQDVRIWSGFLQNEWKNHRWSFLVGARMDKHNLISRVIVSPRMNLRYNPTPDINLRLGYSEGFRAPQAFDEDLHVGFAGGERLVTRLAKNLKEERSRSISVSADIYRLIGNVQTNLLIEGFYTSLNDVFALRTLDEKDAEGNGIQERYNGSGAKVYGFNVEGKAAFTSWFQLQAGITLQKSRYNEPTEWDENAPKERKMMRTPETYGYFTATFTPLKAFNISLSGTYTGAMLVPHAEHVLEDGTKVSAKAVNTPTFFALNLKFAYDFKLSQYANLQLNGGVQNITAAYQKDLDRGWGRDAGYIYGPSQPRSLFVGVKISY